MAAFCAELRRILIHRMVQSVFLGIETAQRSDDSHGRRVVAVQKNEHQRWDVIAKSKIVQMRDAVPLQLIQRYLRPIVGDFAFAECCGICIPDCV